NANFSSQEGYETTATQHDSSVAYVPPQDTVEHVDNDACAFETAQAAAAMSICVGSGVWTAGSLATGPGVVGGLMVTVGACVYAGMESAEAQQACGGATSGPVDPNPDLTWSSYAS